MNIANNDGVTPISIASRSGYYEIVDLLIKTNKVNINAVDKSHENCLFEAITAGSSKLVQLLLANKVCLAHIKHG